MTQQPPYRGSTCTRRRLLQGALGGAAGLTLGPWRVAHATAQPRGQLTVGVHVTLSPTWFDPAETPGIITPFMFRSYWIPGSWNMRMSYTDDISVPNP